MTAPHNAARLTDAVSNYVKPDTRERVKQLLLLGARRKNEPLCKELLNIYPSATLTIVDENDTTLEKISAALTEQAPRIHTVQGNIENLPDLVPSSYDLIITRHPDIIYGRQRWNTILQASASVMKPNGTLIVTTEELADAGFVNEILEAEKLAMIPGTPYTAIPVAHTKLDRYILIYQQAK